MSAILRSLFSLGGRAVLDDHFSDRLSHRVSACLLLLFAIFSFVKQFAGKPLSCWLPNQYQEPQVRYIEDYCWTKGIANYAPREGSTLTVHSPTGIYQWVPLLLLLQAGVYCLPRLLWRFCCVRSGVQLSSIMEVAADAALMRDSDTRSCSVQYLARLISGSLASRHNYAVGCVAKLRQLLAKYCCFLCLGSKFGNTLVCGYTACKLLYIGNAVGQLLLMQRLIGSNSTVFGAQLLGDVLAGQQRAGSANLPVTANCLARVTDSHHDTEMRLPCVLTVNAFNERVFMLLWFWTVLVLCVSVVCFVTSLGRLALRPARVRFVRRFLKQRSSVRSDEKHRSVKFVDEYLQPDGVLTLRLVEQNSGHLLASEVAAAMWAAYKQKEAGGASASGDAMV